MTVRVESKSRMRRVGGRLFRSPSTLGSLGESVVLDMFNGDWRKLRARKLGCGIASNKKHSSRQKKPF